MKFFYSFWLRGGCYLGIQFVMGASLVYGKIQGLVFEHYTIEDVAPLGESSYAFEFPFKNLGDEPVSIEQVVPKCGCTTANLEKRRYAPEEAGSIRGVFALEGRKGNQRKLVQVYLVGQKDPINLWLHLTIPELATVEPQFLLWSDTNERSAQVFSVHQNADFAARVEAVSVSADQAAVRELSPALADDKVRTFEVLPKSGFHGRSAVLLRVAGSNDQGHRFSQTYYVHLVMR